MHLGHAGPDSTTVEEQRVKISQLLAKPIVKEGIWHQRMVQFSNTANVVKVRCG